MIPFVSGSAALRMEPSMSYDPVNFKRMQLKNGSCQIRVSQDQKRNAMFELLCDDVVIMAFLYQNLRPWELNQRRDAFSRLFEAGRDMDGVVYFTMLPTQTVSELPTYPMWNTSSGLGENGFWASSNLRISVKSTGHKMSAVIVSFQGHSCLASFGITGFECDDDEVLDAAMLLRTRLHIGHPIRVESIWEQEKLVWFYPTNLTSVR